MGFGCTTGEGEARGTQFAKKTPSTDLQLETCHAEDILRNMSIFCQRKLFTDIVLRVESREFHCHRAILSANSIYFWTMFCIGLKESQQDTVDIKGVSADTMDCVLDYMYGGSKNIHEDNVQSLLEAADLFQMSGLRSNCEKFLEEQLDPCNCLGILSFANSFSIPTLLEKSRKLLLESFAEVIQHDEFLQVPKSELLDHLSSDLLAVAQEETVFEAVMRWVRHDVAARKCELRELLELVRIPLLDPIYFVEKVEMDELILNSKECFPLLQEARKYHIFGNEITTPRTRPRKFANVAEVIVVVGGCDKKGRASLPYTERYNPGTGEWTQLAKIPDYTKSEFAVCILKNDIFLSGGHLYSKDVWMYNSLLNVWLRVAPLNKGRWRHKMVALQGKIYAVGGFNGFSRISSVECYDPSLNCWSLRTPLLEAVSSAAVTVCLNKVHVIGGALNDKLNSTKVQSFDPLKDEWTFTTTTPFAQRCINAVSLNDSFYVMGGLMECVYKYDPKQDIWTVLTHSTGPLENSGLTVCNGMLYILGGKDDLAEGTDRVLCIDPISSKLSQVSNMPRCVSYHGCVTIHQRVRQ
ncbi:kelch-like protein 24 [Pristis pectinata]|uniref:kelch-like protein 24 n=1 Tax=Pristis pectinata TaxID=685728 RepID=UPI00223E5EF7|nr:kelch-like protein 24 [Pristis pectinata]XP_051881657.1 kelch-like protein 24 [Pristis pectinata]XP_051881658.1 kelch-like protein 24 [Pristis pectinata]XP_051881659.1 kelch-like protein 24 [Pristis pectinata]XP_051881660.1 kelch-like protein 24 [Pristis pectinata]